MRNNQLRVEIKNWKEVVGQFGLTDTKEGLLSAKQLSKLLTEQVKKEATDHVFIKCNTQSDADACFVFSKKSDSTCWYEYIGTAN